jgi:hypothetical protein
LAPVCTISRSRAGGLEVDRDDADADTLTGLEAPAGTEARVEGAPTARAMIECLSGRRQRLMRRHGTYRSGIRCFG